MTSLHYTTSLFFYLHGFSILHHSYHSRCSLRHLHHFTLTPFPSSPPQSSSSSLRFNNTATTATIDDDYYWVAASFPNHWLTPFDSVPFHLRFNSNTVATTSTGAANTTSNRLTFYVWFLLHFHHRCRLCSLPHHVHQQWPPLCSPSVLSHFSLRLYRQLAPFFQPLPDVRFVVPPFSLQNPTSSRFSDHLPIVSELKLQTWAGKKSIT